MAGYEPITRRVYWDDIDTMKVSKLPMDSVGIYVLYLYQKRDGKSIPKYKILGYDKNGVIELGNKFIENEDVYTINNVTSYLTCPNSMYEIPTAIDIETGEII